MKDKTIKNRANHVMSKKNNNMEVFAKKEFSFVMKFENETFGDSALYKGTDFNVFISSSEFVGKAEFAQKINATCDGKRIQLV